MVLQNQGAWRLLGDLETRLLAPRLQFVKLDRPVFITGLARAGTTILLRKLSELPDFASHRYADFPFLFTPYAWSRLRRLAPARPERPRERMHADRIMVTAESPEAMEEILWRAFFPAPHDGILDRQVQHAPFDAFFADHIRKLLLARGASRYVSKNNYNVTRLGYLARLFPDSRFLLSVRSPIAHVASLMKQHDLFCRVQRESEAARRHLRLVGHFEFGLDRRPINPGDGAAIHAIEASWRAGADVRGWAAYWALIYRHVLDVVAADPALAGRCLIVRYEDLCERSTATVAAICRHIGVAPTHADQLADGLSQPTYYAVPFSTAERAVIDEATATVAARLGYGPD